MNNPISNRPDKTLTPLLIPLFLHMAGASPPIYVPSEQITLQCGSSGPKYQNLFHSSTKQVVTNPYPKKHLLPLLPAKLDEKWVTKVSDFGMSKMGTTTMSKTHISTAVKGSFGYLDPEYYRCQQLTVKSDVYSFGVVLCEVLCARPAVLHAAETRQMNLVEWTKSCHCDGELDQIIDPNMKGKIETECLNKYGEIAMSCINGSGMETLSMNDIVRGLEFALQLHQNCDERNKEDAFDSMPGCATNESVQCISETIFSEINDPNGR